jgi:hypothetical protein
VSHSTQLPLDFLRSPPTYHSSFPILLQGILLVEPS